MLKESRILKFLDNENNYTFAFIEGQKLIEDLVLINSFAPASLAYFRNAVLSVAPMLSFLKPKEGIGLYIDSESPYFRLKIEGHSSGTMRTLILPEDINEIPATIQGQVRLTKLLPKNPYTSIIEIDNKTYEEIINEILSVSYQLNALIKVSDKSDQSLLMAKLPSPTTGEKIISPHEYWLKYQKSFNDIFEKGYNSETDIIKEIEKIGPQFLGTQKLKFHCPCSKERMLANIITLNSSEIEEIFSEDNKIEVRCDYCKTDYILLQDEVLGIGQIT